MVNSPEGGRSPAPTAPRTQEVIGILGGMGPAATADFYAKLVALTLARRDQDHPKVVIWADPTVPDRSLALLGRGPDPSEWLARGAQGLAAAGATLVAIPCNTAHAFLPGVAQRIGLPVVHMIDEVAKHVLASHPHAGKVGVLATTGTVRAGLYQDWLGRIGVEVITPSADEQDRAVMAGIRAVKAGDTSARTRSLFEDVAQGLVDRGAELLVAGCTEVPLGLHTSASPAPLIDPAAVLAAAVLHRIGVARRPMTAA